MSELSDAVRAGDRVALLEAIALTLAVRLADAGARDAAPLARQLADVTRELDALRSPEEIDSVDELERARAARRAAAAVSEPPAVQL